MYKAVYFCSVVILFLGSRFSLAQAVKKIPKNITIAISDPFDNPHPYLADFDSSPALKALLYRTLSLDAESLFVPLSYKESARLSASSISKKNLKLTLEFKKGLLWGDGKTLGALDFIYTWSLFNKIDEFKKHPFWGAIDNIKRSPENAEKIIVRFKYWPRNMMQMLHGLYLLPEHIEAGSLLANQTDVKHYRQNSYYTNKVTFEGLYNGAYHLSSYNKGDSLHLKKNKNYELKTAYFDELYFKLIPNPGRLKKALLNGEVNAIASNALPFKDSLKLVEKIQNESLPFEFKFQKDIIFEQLLFPVNHSILGNVQIRKALVQSVDLKAMNNSLYAGRYVAIDDSFYSDFGLNFNFLPYDKEYASILLKNLGWNSSEGQRRVKKSKKLEFDLIINRAHRSRLILAQSLKKQWEEIGAVVRIRQVSSVELFDEMISKGVFNGVILYAQKLSELGDLDLLRPIPAYLRTKSASQKSFKKLEALIATVSKEEDPLVKVSLLEKLVILYKAQLPSMPLFFRSKASFVSKELKEKFEQGELLKAKIL